MAQLAGRAGEGTVLGRRARRGWVPAFSVLGLLLDAPVMGWATVAAPAVQVALVVLGLPSWRCPFFVATGLPCPGCGLSRAMSSLVHGEWWAAVRAHPFAPVFLVGWVVLVGGLVLPRVRRLGFARWLDRVEERSRVVGLVLLAFVGFGVARLIVAALAASS